nr:type II toxin-antitoxin system RnlA family toxin [uncultured Flavobacterium sp.]
MKGLNINRNKIESVLNENLAGKYQITKDTKSDVLIVYKFVATGENTASLNIHYVNDGSTTLQYKTGANQDLSLQIATLIKESCSVKVFKSNSFYLKAIRKEDFDVLVEFLLEENTIESDQTQKNHRIVKIKGHQGDNITLHHHSNGSFQAQGKPKLLFNDIIFLLSELMPFKEIISSQLEFYEYNLTPADYIGELEIKLPIASQYLEEKIKSIISPSLLANKISVEFEDYSILAFPALRGLEGVIKQLFFEKGIVINNKDGFKDYILKQGSKITLTDLAKEDVKCSKTQIAICKMYDFFIAHRNSVFHVDGIISTTRVLSFQEAINIINTSFDLIEKSFTSIKK